MPDLRSGCLIALAVYGALSHAAAAPCANVPYRSSGKAAIIRDIHTYGDAAIAEPRSTIALSYDEQALYVDATLDEASPGYPCARPRTPTDDLTRDDAFQVVLGMADPANVNREILHMGGYVGALDARITSADYYYQFTVNSVGSESRTFNETPLKRPLFTSRVTRAAGRWTVTMRIPLSSMGLARPEGQTLFANFFRFRPPTMTAWTLPGFGGYTGMPFGTLTFLPRGSERSATVESRAPVFKARAATPIAGPAPLSSLKASLGASIEYYPLTGAVVARLVHRANSAWSKARCVLQVSGESQLSRRLSSGAEDLVIARFRPGAQPSREVTVTVLDGDGSVLLTESRSFAPVSAPAWFESKAGIAYLNDKVPAPWTAPKVDGAVVTLAHNRIGFGRCGLFSSVQDDLGELLKGDCRIDVWLGGRRLAFPTHRETVRREGNAVQVRSVNALGTVRIETSSRMDYDGFTAVKVRLRGVVPTAVNRITVRIPIAPAHARFVESNLVQEIRPLNGSGWEAEHGPLWVGDQDKGIRFSYDDDPFLSSNRRSRIRVVRTADTAALEFDLVDRAGQLRDDGHIFRFFLQPTPTKPRTMRQGRSQVQFQWEQWAAHQGQIDQAKIGEVRKWTDALAKQGLVGALYTCQGLAEDDPDYRSYRADLEMQPRWMFYRRAYNPGLGVPCYATCKRGPDGDRVLWGLQQMIAEAHIGGICDDGMSVPWEDGNPAHVHGCGEPTRVEWDRPTESRIPAQRDFLKRLRGLFDAKGGPFVLSAHTGGGLDINTLSFFDGYMEGEQLARFRPGYHIPLSTFAIGYNGLPWGFRTRFWDKTWRRQQGFYWSYAYALLFGGDYEDTDEPYQILKEFEENSTAVFYPYWRPGPHIRLSSRQSVLSYYRKADAALVTVANMNYGSDTVRLNLSRLFPGRSLVVTNLLANAARVRIPQDGVLRRTLGGWQCGVYRVAVDRQTGSAATGAWREVGFQPDRWRLASDRNGVGLQVVKDASGTPQGAAITSTLNQSEAVLELSPGTTSVASGRLMVTHSGRLRLRFGSAYIAYDGRWSSSGLVGGTLFQPAVTLGRPVSVEFSVDGGILQASYDRQPLAAGMRLTAGDGQPLRISTWAGDTLTVKPIVMSSVPIAIYERTEGACRLTGVSRNARFDLSSYAPSDWAFTTGTGGSRTETALDGESAFKMSSIPYVAEAQATLIPHSFGLNGEVSLWVQHTGRLRINIGAGGIMFDGSWTPTGDPAGWSEARLYQPPATFNAPVLLTISMRNGLWTVLYGNRLVLRNASFAGQQRGGNRLTISTWAGDSAIVSVRDISSEASGPQPHGIGQPVE